MIRSVLVLVVILAALVSRADAVTVREVQDAIDKAKAHLYSQQSNGLWEKTSARDKNEDAQDLAGGQWGGLTALCTYALLSSGEDRQEPKLAKAIEFLKKVELVGTYAIAMRCQVWLFLPQSPETRTLMKRDAEKLLALVKTEGEGRGFYNYTAEGKLFSLSRAQYGVLGLWAAAQVGVEVPTGYWQLVEKAWVQAQEEDGGWRYKPGSDDYPVTAGITGAGVATLLITQEFLHASRGAGCNGNLVNQPVEKGLAWLVEHFDQVAPDEKFPRAFPHATIYTIERVGVASGRKHFGGIDWFQHGADWLVRKQRRDGSWSSGDKFIGALSDTCFGLLFLARGRAPITVNKLDYARGAVGRKVPAANWNQRPRDVAHLTRWIGNQVEHDLNWQIIDLAAPPEDLQDAPILYISGDKDPQFDESEAAKFKQFIEAGGLIFANADCGGRGFSTAIRKLGTELFPDYVWRELPADHVIYTEQLFARQKWKNKPSLLALGNGARELILLVPQADPSRQWQLNKRAGKEDLWQFAADIYLYAVDKQEIRFRGDTHLVTPDSGRKPTRAIEVARLRHGPGSDPEPGGWRRLAAVMHNEQGVELRVSDADVAQHLPNNARIAHITGTDTFQFSDPARANVRKFVESGGTLVVDAAGGSAAFADAAEAEINAIFPGAKLMLLPADHALYTTGAKKPLDVSYRRYAGKSLGVGMKTPRLRAITLDGRIVVVFSREDLSVGLVGQPVDGIIGYDPRTATALMSRILLHASPAPKPLGTKPSPRSK